MKRLPLRLALVALSLAVGLVAVELAVRWLDPFGISYYRDNHRYFEEAVQPALGPDGGFVEGGRLFQNKPGVELELVRFRYCTDAFGLRSPEPGRPLPPPQPREARERLRLLFLGDSVTLAWGVDDEHTWVRRLEREGRAPDGRPIECLNAGHLMYDTVQEADLLRVWGPKLRPDVVVVMFIANDLVSSYQTVVDGFARQQDAAAEGGLWHRLHSLFGQSFYGLQGLLNYRRNAAQLAGIPELSFGGIEDVPGYPDGWPRCRAALTDMRATCEALGARFVVFDHTIPPLPELAAWCTEAGVDRVGTSFTDEEWRQDIRNSAVDSHFNALGNRYIAEKALAGLRGLGVLGR